MEHRVQFLRNQFGHPVGCIAIKMTTHPLSVERQHYDVVEYQHSVLNPVDQFDKRFARQLALGRLADEPVAIRVPANPTMYEVSRAIMKDIARDSFAPSRARKAARQWLKNNTERDNRG